MGYVFQFLHLCFDASKYGSSKIQKAMEGDNIHGPQRSVENEDMNASKQKTCRFCRFLDHPWCPFVQRGTTVESPCCGQFTMVTDPRVYKARKLASIKQKEEQNLKRHIEL